jgi:hypothetical protein
MVNFYEFYSVRLKINTLEISVLEYNLIWKIARTFCSTKSVIANGIGAIKDFFLTLTKLMQKFFAKIEATQSCLLNAMTISMTTLSKTTQHSMSTLCIMTRSITTYSKMAVQ